MRRLIVILASLVLLLCANQMPPTGGPDDATRPSVVTSYPAHGALNVSGVRELTMVFSEWVELRSAERAVSVFPPPPGGYRVSVRGRRLTVDLESELEDSTTYHVEVSSLLEDLHRVSIGTPYHLVFSTGPVLDSGLVWGCIFDTDPRPAQPRVALYGWRDGAGHDSALLQLPTYLIQTDSSKTFAFRHIHSGVYDVVAFLDADNNGRLGPGRERAFASAQRRVSVDSAAGPVHLYPVVVETTTVKVATLKALTPRILEGTWSDARGVQYPAFDSTWHIETPDSVPVRMPIAGVTALGGGARFIARLDDTLTARSYRMVYRPFYRFAAEEVPDSLRDTIRFNGVVSADTTPPAIHSTWPRGVVEQTPAVKLVWSEPVVATAATATIADSSGDTVTLVVDTSAGDTTRLTVARALRNGSRYRARIPHDIFADLSGNVPVDTSDTPGVVVEFSTVHADSMCLSLSGASGCTTPGPGGTWVFTPLGGRATPAICADSSGTFKFDSIPSGRGTMSYFADLDGDGRHTEGSLFPWRAPELYLSFPDTVEARARWDIDGVNLDNCPSCPQPKAPVDSSKAAGRPAERQDPAE